MRNGHQSLNPLYRPYLEAITLFDYVLNVDYFDRFNEKTVEFPHVHFNLYEIYYVEEGKLIVQINDEVFEIPSGSFVVLSPNIRHGSLYTPRIKKNYFVILFDFYRKNPVSTLEAGKQYEEAHINAFKNIMDEKGFIVCEDQYRIDNYLNTLIDEINNKNFGWEFVVRSKYVEMISKLLRNFVSTKDLGIEPKVTNMAVAITKYMHQNYEKPITINDIAEEFSISKRHVIRVFNEYFGTSPSKTLTLYRLSYAKNYLIETDYTLSMIAERVGFSSARTFSKLFKENEGITITEFRAGLANRG